MTNPRIHRLVLISTQVIVGALTAWVIVILLAYSINLVRAPFQLEYREGAILATTSELLAGRNPWSPQSQPAQMNSYGFLYHLVMLPLAGLFGNSFLLHRLVSGLGSFFSAAVVTLLLWRRGAPVILAIGGGALVFANQLFYVTPLSRPDGLGFLLFILAAFIPWAAGYSRHSLALSGLLAVLAFYTKAYFIFSAVIVAGTLLFQRRAELWRYALWVAGLLVISVPLAAWIFPYYFYDTFYNHLILASRKLEFLTYQSLLFASIYFVPILMVTWQAARALQRWITRKAGPVLDLPQVGLVGSLLVIGLSMGWHPGTLMTYYFHLITPFLVIVWLELVRTRQKLETVANLGLAITLFANLMILGVNLLDGRTVPASLVNIPDLGQSDWALVREKIASSQHILNSPAMVGEMVLQDREITNNGQTEFYFFSMQGVPDFFLLPSAADVLDRGVAHQRFIQQKVASEFYDWVVVSVDQYNGIHSDAPLEVIQQHYRKVDEARLEMPQANQTWTLQFWAPRSR